MKKGVTLVELVAALVILSVTVLVFVGSFTNISKSIISSKAKTLATNLAQEKIQILRQKPYHRILVTPAPSYYTEVTPPIPYDTEYFPPENILEGGINFKRFTYVCSVQEIDGKIHPLPPGSPDQGMKSIQVSVVYDSPFGKKYVTLKSIEANPSMEAFRGQIMGKVRNAANLQGLKDALVVVAENIGCRDYTNAAGDYSIRVPFGTYNVMATLRGFYPSIKQITVGANPQTLNFDLQPISTGTVYGYVWINDRIVISQIVGSTRAPNGFVQEYIELYNPTTFYWQMAVSVSSGIIGIKYQSTFVGDTLRKIPLVYNTLILPPFSYYLIANTTTVRVAGVTKTADAVFSNTDPEYPNIIKTYDENNIRYAGGSIVLYHIPSDTPIDIVGWDALLNDNINAKRTAPLYETDGIDQNFGLEEDEQYIRKVSTFNVFISGWGNCYDSDNNNKDFAGAQRPIQIAPKNSQDSFPPLTGRPGFGSIISCNDGVSEVTSAVPYGDPPVALFFLLNVATGSWSVMISSNERHTEINNVNVGGTTALGIPNAFTSPAWYAPYFYTQLSSSTELGFISGRVLNLLGQPLGGIKVETPGGFTYTNSLGFYFLASSTGIYTVTCNPHNLNPLYVSLRRENVEVKRAQITSGVNFILSQGGKVTGFVTIDRINPLEGIPIVATTIEGFVVGEDVSDNNGRFYISNLSSGTYYIKPILSAKETSIPAVSTVTVTAGVNVFAGTFTITGTMGKISGKVTASGKPISTGVLIIASTATIITPPVLSTATLTSAAYFLTSSYEDGTYVLEVIGSTVTRYNLYGYYTTYDANGNPNVSRREILNILVPPGSEVTNRNFSW
ncbi:MAG: carboxypeptidase regulatory-like domain-containing protein [Endomicrobiia bacterium]